MSALPRLLLGAPETAESWCRSWRASLPACRVLVLLAATDTAAVPGISAAGTSPESRRVTAAADAELLVLGPTVALPHALPSLPAGVSPALISQVVLQGLGLHPLVIDLGCAVAPAVPHLRLPPPAGAGPARCLSTGSAMDRPRVEALLEQGRRWGLAAARSAPFGGPPLPLVLAECVPGGTTTAQALLTGLGIDSGGIVSGSLHRPAHALKADLVARGLAAAAARTPLPAAARRMPPDPVAVLAALGDPMQALAAGLLLAAAETGQSVLLAGGSQMAAVLALALALLTPELRPRLAALAAIGTTAWVAFESDSDLALLLRRVGRHWGIDHPLAFAASLRFRGALHPALLDYERGYVKEGVGAGGLAILWELAGRSPEHLARACDVACHELLGPPWAPPACPLVAPGSGDPLRSSDG
ncbi:MAG: nicotinate-nucleotide--dimethylbenzimidazole phosphoribosyltransferase [Cyanobacteria bacterium]|nr:nicotinate-nucleotide--dimethylbenzimidazole phosphoribosyltransferase [Cyanobacteriota bacterium]